MAKGDTHRTVMALHITLTAELLQDGLCEHLKRFTISKLTKRVKVSGQLTFPSSTPIWS